MQIKQQTKYPRNRIEKTGINYYFIKYIKNMEYFELQINCTELKEVGFKRNVQHRKAVQERQPVGDVCSVQPVDGVQSSRQMKIYTSIHASTVVVSTIVNNKDKLKKFQKLAKTECKLLVVVFFGGCYAFSAK